MTLAPPLSLEPGTCGCSIDGRSCACMPADVGERLSALTLAKYRADAATDPDEKARLTAEKSRLARELNEAMEFRPAGERKDDMTTTKSNEWPDGWNREMAIGALNEAGVLPVLYDGDPGDKPELSDSWLMMMLELIGRLKGARMDSVREPLTRELRATMTRNLSELCLSAGDGGGDVLAQERHLREQSDVGFMAYVTTMAKAKHDQIQTNSRQREDAKRRDYSQVTEQDRQQAAREIEVYYQDQSRYASPHASRYDEADHVRAVESRSRTIARRRVALENANAMARERMESKAESPRTDVADEEPDPFDPARNGVGQYASPPPGHRRKGR